MRILPRFQFVLLFVLGVIASFSLKSQNVGQKTVSVNVNLLPVLQLEVTNNNQIDFVFDEITDYQAGIVKYGATTLKVSSTVNWDLYAVGKSSGNSGPGYWDMLSTYPNSNPKAISKLPLSLLELKQSVPNAGANAASGLYADYSSSFSPYSIPSGQNSIYVNGGTTAAPSSDHKYIGGHSGTSGIAGQDHLPGGSYLMQNGQISNYIYSIDYRILPGIPAIFPMATDPTGITFLDLVTENGSGSFAAPGIYSMNVQYILVEDQ